MSTNCIQCGQADSTGADLHCDLCRAAEIRCLNQWIDDLQKGMYINCVYCGHRYGPQRGAFTMMDVLKAHISHCPKHPMSKMRKALAFAASVIKSGEAWSDQCEEIIGGALDPSHLGKSATDR